MSITNLKRVDVELRNGGVNAPRTWEGNGDPSQNPSGSITVYASAAGGAETTVTSNAHGLANDDKVSITGTTAYNGIFTVASVTTNTFQIKRAFATDEATGTWKLSPDLANDIEFPIGSTYTNLDTGMKYTKTAAGTWTYSDGALVIVATSTSTTTDFGDLKVGDTIIVVPATPGNATFGVCATAGTLPFAAVIGDLYFVVRKA